MFEHLLEQIALALEAAGLDYMVIGGQAVHIGVSLCESPGGQVSLAGAGPPGRLFGHGYSAFLWISQFYSDATTVTVKGS